MNVQPKRETVRKGLVNIKPVLRVNIPETLLQIPVDCHARFKCKDFAPLPSVTAAIYRLNKKEEDPFFIELIGNGSSYIIYHRKHEQAEEV